MFCICESFASSDRPLMLESTFLKTPKALKGNGVSAGDTSVRVSLYLVHNFSSASQNAKNSESFSKEKRFPVISVIEIAICDSNAFCPAFYRYTATLAARIGSRLGNQCALSTTRRLTNR